MPAEIPKRPAALAIGAAVIALIAALIFCIASNPPRLSEQRLANPPGAHVLALAVHPADPDVRLVSTSVGLYATRDSGRTWELSDLPESWRSPVISVLFDQALPESAYVVGEFGLGISRDGGLTWSVATAPPGAAAYLGLVQSPAGGALYIVAPNGLLKSADGGESWSAIPVSPEYGRLTSLAPHPAEPNSLIAGCSLGLIVSEDGGASWRSVSQGPEGPIDWVATLEPQGKALLASAPSGIHASEDGGTSWQPAPQTAGSSLSMAGAGSPWADQRIAEWLLHTEPEALFGLLDGEALLAASASYGQVGLIATETSMYETTDGGRSWSPWITSLPAMSIDELTIAPSDPQRLYASTPMGFSHSTDGGQSWSLPRSLGAGHGEILSIAVDAQDGASVFALCADGAVLHASDGGETWQALPVASSLGTEATALVHFRDAQNRDVLCLLADELMCVDVEGGAEWLQVGPGYASAAPVTLQASAESIVLTLTDGSVYSAAPSVRPDWAEQCPKVPAVDAVEAAWADSRDGYILDQLGRVRRCSRGAWEPMPATAGTPVEVERALLIPGSQPGNDPQALLSVDGRVDLLADGGTMATLEASDGTSALVPASGTGNALAYRVNGRGALYRIEQRPALGHSISRLLAVLGGLLALAGAVLHFAPRVRRRVRRASAGAAEFTREPESATAAPPATAGQAEPCTEPPVAASELRSRLGPEDMLAPTGDANATRARDLGQRLGLDLLSEQRAGALVGFMLDTAPLRLNLPPAVPLVIVPSGTAAADQAGAIRDLTARLGAVSPFALVIDGEPADTAAQTASMEAAPSAGGLILIDSDRLAEILASDDPGLALGQTIQSNIPLAQVSPYVQSGPVPHGMFFGREYEVKVVARALNDRSFAILGGRKIGKTSFLRQLHRSLSHSSDFWPLFVDCHHVSDDASFLKTLSLAGQVPVESASMDVLRRVVLRLKARGDDPDRLVVLELDEVDNLMRFDRAQGGRLTRVFRSLSDEGLCRFVLGGERILNAVLNDDDLPLRSFCGTLHLGYLAQEEAQRLAREPLAGLGITMENPEQLLAEIVLLSGRHPNILQVICQMLVERAAERAERVVRLSDLEDIEHSSEFRELFFEIIWGNATTLERLISVVMAQREAFILEQVRLALEALGLRIPQDVIAAALDGLMLSSLVAAKEGRYTFTSEAFPRILRASGLAQGFRDSLAEMLIEGQELS
ncbi:MAG: hypothetical protein GXX94_10035 [Chloroflexi bacterium]|nr:hypothetical protein [Chloroflexota bacterium]